MAVDLAAAISAHRSGNEAAQNALADKGEVLASIDVTRVPGEVSPACPGP
jgi:hypothetical protein